MRRFLQVLLAVAMMWLWADQAHAALVGITGSSGADFRAWNSGDVNNNGTPYWDHTSGDGTSMNIGYWLTGTGAFVSDPNSPHLAPPPQYWGYSTGAADLNYFVSSTTASKTTLKLEIAGYSNTNSFGYYHVSDGILHELFTGAESAGAVDYITFNISDGDDIGFYIQVVRTGNIYYTQSSKNTTATNMQHFALFGMGDGSYYVASEDLSLGDADYNDLVVKVKPIAAPETGAGLMLMMGLAALVGYRREKRMA